MSKTMTNQQFAQSDREFQAACERAGLPPTKRQASKFRLKFGKAYEAWKFARSEPVESYTPSHSRIDNTHEESVASQQ